MAFQDSYKTIEKLYEILDFQPGENLATIEAPSDKKYEGALLDSAKKKLGVESIFFYRPPNGGTSIPHIYFRRLEGQNPTEVSRELAEFHKLAWNMGQAPLLFAVLPDGYIRIYNAYDTPVEFDPNHEYQAGLLDALNIFVDSQKENLKSKYQRREFESGHFWRQYGSRFDPKKRADQTLLENLKFMRRELLAKLSVDISSEMASKIVHSLLGRAIFIKYLEDRKDSAGKNVFPDNFFESYWTDAACFTDVLSNKEATYKLFEYLNDKFNGDIFPIDDIEKRYIQFTHLNLLKSFLTGEEELRTGQLRLWKFYSFDVIPIEFISNIYEEFFHIRQKEKAEEKSEKTGTHYTPHHLVEFLVDEVFPWEGTNTSFKVLDPACGSGIFLVEIYRRLIAHWRQANPDEKITDKELKRLLADNIFGVDLDSEAVRVAAFSLYLTLCDYLEPRQIWEKVKFPLLRDNNLYPVDFFEADQLFAEKQYDLIIGNPPWQSELTPAAEKYRKGIQTKFPERQVAPDNQIALAFLWRASELCQSSGEVCLLMPSKGLLFNRSETHKGFRREFFAKYHIKTIINFSASRHILFEKGVGPGAAIFYAPHEPDETIPILYCSPKPTHTIEDKWQITIEPQDIAQLPRTEADESDIIWKVAMWGGPRDYELIKKLMSPPYRTLESICDDKRWIHGEGVTKGNQKNDASWFLGKPYVDAKNLERFVINENSLPLFNIPKLENVRNKKRAIFAGPHILLKQSPMAGEKSFRAALLKNDYAVFKHSLMGISGSKNDINLLTYYCLILNSRIPLYFALMTSRRWLVERDELEKDEIMSFPMPEVLVDNQVSFEYLKKLAQDKDWENKVKNLVERLYDFTEDEQILIDDALNYTLDYFRLKAKSEAAKPTLNQSSEEHILEEYLRTAQKTLQNSFGQQFQSIIFQGVAPLRVVALRLLEENNSIASQNLVIEKSQDVLDQVLEAVDQYLIEQRSPGVFIRRHVRGYIDKTIYVIKPDQHRYWTKAIALQDADEIYSEIMQAWRS